MTTAQQLEGAAQEAVQRGASDTAVAILRRASAFAARQFRGAAPDDPHWTPKPVPAQPPTGIERGLVNDAVTPEDRNG